RETGAGLTAAYVCPSVSGVVHLTAWIIELAISLPQPSVCPGGQLPGGNEPGRGGWRLREGLGFRFIKRVVYEGVSQLDGRAVGVGLDEYEVAIQAVDEL